MKPWYVVHCKPKSEHIALEHLERQGYRCYLPMRKVFARQKTSLSRLEVMFPRYLFCQVQNETQSLAPIRSTQGVLGLIRFGLQPAPLDDAIVAYIRAQEALQHNQAPAELANLSAGVAVRIVTGPLAQLEGLVHQVSQHRVAVLLELLGKPLKINLKLAEVALI